MQVDNRPLLLDLWQALLDALRQSFTKTPKRPSVEMLAVTRRWLRDNSTYCPDDASRRKLEQLYRLYCSRLVEAMEGDQVNAATLAEARKFLEWQGLRADIPKHQAVQVAKQLSTGALPFTNPLRKH